MCHDRLNWVLASFRQFRLFRRQRITAILSAATVSVRRIIRRFLVGRPAVGDACRRQAVDREYESCAGKRTARAKTKQHGVILRHANVLVDDGLSALRGFQRGQAAL